MKFSIVCLFIAIGITACGSTPKYFSARNNIDKVPCFGEKAVRSYLKKIVPHDELDFALKRANGILVKGMYPFIFQDVDVQNIKEIMEKKVTNLNCSEDKWEIWKSSQDIRAYVSLSSHVIFNQDEQNNITKSAETKQQKEITMQKDKIAEKGSITKKDISIQKETTISNNDASDLNESPKTDSGNPLFKKTQLIITSYLYSVNPADRLEKVYSLITPLHGGVLFLSSKNIEEKRELIEFGTVTDKVTLSTSGIPITKSLGNVVSLTPTLENTLNRKIARQYMIQNVEIFPLRNVLLVSQDGGPAGAEISGNSVVDVSLKIPPDLCQYFTPVSSFKLEKIEDKYVLELNMDDPICYVDKVQALVASILVVRNVVKGQETVKEDDDTITPVVFRNALITDLWKNSESLFGLKFVSGVIEQPLKIQGNLIVFKKFETALDFRNRFSISISKEALSGPLSVKVNQKTGITDNWQLDALDSKFLKSGAFQVCIAGTTTTDLSSYFISKSLDLCGGYSK